MIKANTKDVNYRVNKSQKFFTPLSLYFYDLVVFDIVTKYFWKCSVPTLINHYNKFLSTNHLEVGVGTGYLLDHCMPSSTDARLGLMDLSKSCLEKTMCRLSYKNPEIYTQNILMPIQMHAPKFDSIGINFVMHCVPGHLSDKGIAFEHLKTLLNKDGILFGSSVMYKAANQNIFTKILMKALNKFGVFNNTKDTPDALYQSLKKVFNNVQLDIVGSAVLFSARD